jgi:hypothetical protein
MRVREYQEKDLARIEELYDKQKADFELPDPFDVRVIIRRCLVDDREKIQLVGFGRVQLNAYLLIDGAWRTPQERLEGIEILEASMIAEAKIKGFDEVTAQVSKRFGARLKDLGWAKSQGQTWHRKF